MKKFEKIGSKTIVRSMITRMFLARVHCVVIALLGLCSILHAERLETVLRDGWRFQQGDPAAAETTGFKDNEWNFLSIPHTWNHADEPLKESENGRYLRGPGWYRRTLEFSENPSSDRTFLRFEAASLLADVYLNGTKLGQHRGGFTAFTFEITDVMKPGPNLLAVRVDNTCYGDIAPLSGDFTIFGGLYRSVHLLKTGPFCISPLVHGSRGIRIRQSKVSHERATVSVTALLSNKYADVKSFTLRTSVLNSAGKAVAVQKLHLLSNAVSADTTLNIVNPHLWNGIADPYLYSVQVELIVDDKVVDRIIEPLGLRFFSFDKDKGFILNGRPCRLRGVCCHQDFGDKGWAAEKEDMDRDMVFIREIGANAIRLAHYPHSDYFLQLCDRYGIIAWSEIPLVNMIGKAEGFAATSTQQLQEMIAQLGNHPSIVTWGLWNELQGGAPALPMISKLNDLAHSLDPTRPTTAASFSGSQKWCPSVTKVTDLLAINTYQGWYRGMPEGMNNALDRFHEFAPNQPLGVSEYGAGASIRQHEQGMTQRPAPRGPWHPEEWQAIVHEAHWKAIKSRPFIWGSFIWNMFDFASAGRKEGDMPGINDKGLVTRDRKVKKDAFYFYKASWSLEPVVYITSRRDDIRKEACTPLKVYSNTDHLKLTLNGEDLSAGQHDGVIYQWKEITLQQGKNVLDATAERGGKTITDRVTWNYTKKKRLQ